MKLIKVFHRILALKETITPAALAGWGKVYTKSDNLLYFLDGGGTERQVSTIEHFYCEAYTYNNAIPTVIETANTPIALRVSTPGLMNGFTFHSGGTGAITAFADGTGGTVLVSSAGHGLNNGDIITIRGTVNYNGVFEVSAVTTNTFKITDTWVINDGASDWDQPGHVVYDGIPTAIFAVSGQVTMAPSAACKIIWKLYVNTTPQDKSIAEREYAINDLDVCPVSCLIQLSTGDILWLSVESDSTQNITIKHGEFNGHRH